MNKIKRSSFEQLSPIIVQLSAYKSYDTKINLKNNHGSQKKSGFAIM